MSAKSLHEALLRPAIIQILRAAGYQATKPSVIDTLTDMASRYIQLLALRTAEHASVNHNDIVPTITDVRMALNDCGQLTPSQTASEETWKELMRQPLHQIPERNLLRQKEAQRRDDEDTQEIKDFVAWFHGSVHHEMKRIAGLLQEDHRAPPIDGMEIAKPEDYLSGMWYTDKARMGTCSSLVPHTLQMAILVMND